MYNRWQKEEQLQDFLCKNQDRFKSLQKLEHLKSCGPDFDDNCWIFSSELSRCVKPEEQPEKLVNNKTMWKDIHKKKLSFTLCLVGEEWDWRYAEDGGDWKDTQGRALVQYITTLDCRHHCNLRFQIQSNQVRKHACLYKFLGHFKKVDPCQICAPHFTSHECLKSRALNGGTDKTTVWIKENGFQ